MKLRKLNLGMSMLCLLLAIPSASLVAAQKTKETKETTKAGRKTAPASPVDLNTASQDELESIPGIGAPTAKKIIAGRPYNSVADLAKAGLPAKQVQELTPMVKVSAAQPTRSAAPDRQPSAPATTSRSAPVPAPASNTPAAAPAAGGGRDQVWVNTETKVFHRQGDRWYGTTKKGKYMTEPDALKAGYRASKEEVKR